MSPAHTPGGTLVKIATTGKRNETLRFSPSCSYPRWQTLAGHPPDFSTFKAEGTGLFTGHATLAKGTRPLTLSFDNACWQPTEAVKLNEMLSLKPCEGTPPQWRLFREGDYQMRIDTRSGTPTLMLTVQSVTDKPVTDVTRQCPKWGRQAPHP
ncbi:periplasmic alpha-amylase [Lelliottia amnigena]|nr:periplasmic alpha-amylase [Lelliottia amnigena]